MPPGTIFNCITHKTTGKVAHRAWMACRRASARGDRRTHCPTLGGLRRNAECLTFIAGEVVVARKHNTKRTVAVAARLVATLLNSSSYALADQISITRSQNLLQGDGLLGVGKQIKPDASDQPTTSRRLLKQYAANGIDDIKVPPPYVAPTNKPAYLALEQKASGDVSAALDRLKLTGDQRIAVRNYIGQYSSDVQVIATGTMNNSETLVLKKRGTDQVIGTVDMKTGADGAIIVNKVTGAEFDFSKKLEIPLTGRVDEADAQRALGGSLEYKLLNEEASNASLSATLPSIKAEAGFDYGKAREATATFNPDGSGHEYGLSTKIGVVKGEATAGVTGTVGTENGAEGYSGIRGGVGAKAFEVEVFANRFGQPEVDSEGNLTHSVVGGSFEMHTTLAEAEAKLGCSTTEGCDAKASFGALGIGSGASVNYSPHLRIPVESTEEIPEHGVAANPHPTVVTPNAAEDAAYTAAVADGSPDALKKFLEDYPTSTKMDQVLNLIDLGASGEAPDVPTGRSGGHIGATGY